MNVIIPMAGLGSRLKPITPTTPKPLIKLAGKTIIHRIIEELYQYNQLEKIGFVIQSKQDQLEEDLREIVRDEFNQKIQVYFFYQKKARGTAHAIYCAKELLQGKVLVIFSDTLFFLKKAIKFNQLEKYDGAIFVKKVKNPSAYGVVHKNESGEIINFIEKPTKPISNLAIIGVYYFKDAARLQSEIRQIISKKILEKREYQLTTALRKLSINDAKFTTIEVEDWLDCGTPNKLLETNQYLLKNKKQKIRTTSSTAREFNNKEVISPSYIGENVVIKNSTIGPHVSIEDNCVIEDSKITHSIIQEGVIVKKANITNSIIGKHSQYNSESKSVIIGPHSNLNIE